MSTRPKQIAACMQEIDEITKKYKLTNLEFAMVLGGVIGAMKRPDHITLKTIVDRVHGEAVRFDLFRKSGGVN